MQTKRLTFRPLALDDAPRLAELAGDWDIARMTARIPFPYSTADAEEWIAGQDEGEFVRGLHVDGMLMGVAGYVAHRSGSAELGYWIGKPWWGRGFATEAARAIMRHCFRQAGFRRLTCSHFHDNPASARVIAKLEFRSVGQDRVWCEARQEHVPALTYERRRPLLHSIGF